MVAIGIVAVDLLVAFGMVIGVGHVASHIMKDDEGPLAALYACELFGEGIVKGYSEVEFAPNDNITREQIAAIMHRYAAYKKYDTSAGENTNILSYADYAEISEYAIPSVQYAVGSGLIKGKTDSTINPSDNATRAETAEILKRFIEANK